MALKHFNPTSPSRRGLVLVDRSELYKGRPEKSLVEGLTKSAGVPALATWETARRLASSALPELPAMEVRGKSVAVRIFSIER